MIRIKSGKIARDNVAKYFNWEIIAKRYELEYQKLCSQLKDNKCKVIK